MQSVYRIEPDFVAAQLDSVFSDVRIDTTKIGMLAETDIVEAVAERLRRFQVRNVVLDTVMLAKSGDPLLSSSAVETLRTRLLPQVSIITPNSPEAAALLETTHAQTEQEMLEQGRALRALGCEAVLMKGGHLDDAQSPDWLFTREGEQRFTAPRVKTKTPMAPVVRCRQRWLRYVRVMQAGLIRCRRPKCGSRRHWPGQIPGSGRGDRSGTPFPRVVVTGINAYTG